MNLDVRIFLDVKNDERSWCRGPVEAPQTNVAMIAARGGRRTGRWRRSWRWLLARRGGGRGRWLRMGRRSWRWCRFGESGKGRTETETAGDGQVFSNVFHLLFCLDVNDCKSA